MALKWPSMCWCAVKKLLTHSLHAIHGQRCMASILLSRAVCQHWRLDRWLEKMYWDASAIRFEDGPELVLPLLTLVTILLCVQQQTEPRQTQVWCSTSLLVASVPLSLSLRCRFSSITYAPGDRSLASSGDDDDNNECYYYYYYY